MMGTARESGQNVAGMLVSRDCVPSRNEKRDRTVVQIRWYGVPIRSPPAHLSTLSPLQHAALIESIFGGLVSLSATRSPRSS